MKIWLEPVIYLTIGSKVYISKNINVNSGLYNE